MIGGAGERSARTSGEPARETAELRPPERQRGLLSFLTWPVLLAQASLAEAAFGDTTASLRAEEEEREAAAARSDAPRTPAPSDDQPGPAAGSAIGREADRRSRGTGSPRRRTGFRPRRRSGGGWRGAGRGRSPVGPKAIRKRGGGGGGGGGQRQRAVAGCPCRTPGAARRRAVGRGGGRREGAGPGRAGRSRPARRLQARHPGGMPVGGSACRCVPSRRRVRIRRTAQPSLDCVTVAASSRRACCQRTGRAAQRRHWRDADRRATDELSGRCSNRRRCRRERCAGRDGVAASRRTWSMPPCSLSVQCSTSSRRSSTASCRS